MVIVPQLVYQQVTGEQNGIAPDPSQKSVGGDDVKQDWSWNFLCYEHISKILCTFFSLNWKEKRIDGMPLILKRWMFSDCLNQCKLTEVWLMICAFLL